MQLRTYSITNIIIYDQNSLEVVVLLGLGLGCKQDLYDSELTWSSGFVKYEEQLLFIWNDNSYEPIKIYSTQSMKRE